MTVAELIKLLLTLPQDMDVGILNWDARLTMPIVEVDDIGSVGKPDKVVIIRSGYIYSDEETSEDLNDDA